MTAALTPAQKPGFPSRNLTGQDRALFYPDAAALGCGHRAGSTLGRKGKGGIEGGDFVRVTFQGSKGTQSTGPG